ncbi:MAG: hypothetical protein ACLQJR_00640 [Stellaceae bacterium]
MTLPLPEFAHALYADGAATDRTENLALYGWLIGSWALDISEVLEDGTTRRRPGEWHFGWVLEGRAIQDVWIVPPRGARRAADATAAREYYGTTLRVYDPAIDAWHIQWTDPVVQAYLAMIGRKQGEDIVQEGKDAAGSRRRWSFSEITPHAFRWRGEVSLDNGATWQCHIDFRARRAGARPRLD